MQINTDEERTERAEGILEMEPVIDITGLRFSWPGSLSPVLAIDQFKVDAGELLFIMGPSGSGKSTLLGILTGILVPQDGEVNILGQLLSTLNGSERDSFRADNIGYIFQMFNLIPYLSVVENVTLPCQFSLPRKKNIQQQGSSPQDEAIRLLKRLNLGESEILNKSVVELSVGQQQRVAAARALIGGPSLVIADEPTSSLDTDHRESFLRLLFDECSRSGSTLVFVSHDTGLKSFFNRTVDFREANMAFHQSEGATV